MIFGEFDWGQVGQKALIGAVIGGVVGLCIALVKKAQGGKTAKPDDAEDDDRPRKRRQD